MPYAVELTFDNEADELVRAIWRRVAEAGIPSLYKTPYDPHVSLTVCDQAEPGSLEGVLVEQVDSISRLTLLLGHVGYFASEEAVAFLGVAPSESLLRAHRAMDAAISKISNSIWAYYRPGVWVPHCTIGIGVAGSDLDKVVSLCAEVMPIHASVKAVAVVEVPSGEIHVQIPV